MKVGSSKVEKTDVRVIAATNVNLAYAVATGKFREDLYYRLTGIQIQMPALRERNKDDIYLLFRKFTSDFSERYNLCKVNLNHDAISMLTAYRWPGNIRQLAGGSMSDSDKQMIIKALLDLKQEVDRLKEIVNAGGAAQQPMPTALPHYAPMPSDEPEEQLSEPEPSLDGISIRKASDELIERALAKHGGKVKPAAAELGISERTIYRKLAEWKEKGKRV